MSNESIPLPEVSEEILKYLDVVYPERVPDFGLSDRQVARAIGHREVVRLLWSIYHEQNDRGDDHGI